MSNWHSDKGFLVDLPANAWSVRGYEYSLVFLMYSIFICHNTCPAVKVIEVFMNCGVLFIRNCLLTEKCISHESNTLCFPV